MGDRDRDNASNAPSPKFLNIEEDWERDGGDRDRDRDGEEEIGEGQLKMYN